jgi:DNA-directed RNA polymerase specialized sigma24 family protein
MHPTAEKYLEAVVTAYRCHELTIRTRQGNFGFDLMIDRLLHELLSDASNTLKQLGAKIAWPPEPEVKQVVERLHEVICRRLLPDDGNILAQVFEHILGAVEYAPRRRLPWDEQNQREEGIQELVRRVLDTEAEDHIDLTGLPDEERRRRIFQAADTDYQRQSRREEKRCPIMSDSVTSCTNNGIKSMEDTDLLQRLLNACSREERLCLRLFYFEHIPANEIAVIMQVQLHSVYQLRGSAIRKCRDAARLSGILVAD